LTDLVLLLVRNVLSPVPAKVSTENIVFYWGRMVFAGNVREKGDAGICKILFIKL